jgi:hypothetical protein
MKKVFFKFSKKFPPIINRNTFNIRKNVQNNNHKNKDKYTYQCQKPKRN